MDQNTSFTILYLLQAEPQWLALSREKRAAFFSREIEPLFKAYPTTTMVRMFDSEYAHARVSDFLIIETSNWRDYQRLVERLRDSALYALPYFRVSDIIVGSENAFREFDAEFREGKA